MVGELSYSENESEETQYSPSGKYVLGSPQFPKLIKVSKTENGILFTFEVSTDHRRGKMFTRCFLKHNQARFLSSDYLWYYRINCVIADCPFTCLIRPLIRNSKPISAITQKILGVNNWEVLENSENHVCNHDSQTFYQDESVKEGRFSVYEKLQILNYSDSNPKPTLKGTAEHFSTHFGRTISKSTVSAIRKNREKLMDEKREENVTKMFSQELYKELSRRQSLTDEYLASYENWRAIARELAADPKYKGYLSSHKFSKNWYSLFREKYMKDSGNHVSKTEKQQILLYIDYNPESTVKEIAQHFSICFGRPISEKIVQNVRKTESNRPKFYDERKIESSSK